MVTPYARLSYDPNHMEVHFSLPTELQASATSGRLAPGDSAFRMGEAAACVFFLRAGAVRLCRHGPQGEVVTIHHAVAGEFFAEASLLSEHYHCDAIATRDSWVESLPSDPLRKLLRSNPQFAEQWVGILSRQLRRTRASVERLSLKGAEHRLRHLLLTEGHGPAGRLEIPGTAKELAAYLGLTHESLYRTMAAMKKNGALQQEGKMLWLTSK